MWKAVRDLLPHSQLIGCQFHFSQALYRKIVEVGLGQTYREREDKYLYLRKVMALPFLPADHIEDAFENLMEQAEELGNDQVLSFMTYVKRTWIDSQVWPPINWSVFDETTRTNNDVEGWHYRMNLKISAKPPLYVAIPQLHVEAKFMDLQVSLVSQMALTTDRKNRYKKTHGKLYKLWADYEGGIIGTDHLLKHAAHLAGFDPIARVVVE